MIGDLAPGGRFVAVTREVAAVRRPTSVGRHCEAERGNLYLQANGQPRPSPKRRATAALSCVVTAGTQNEVGQWDPI
jgi:hypothetical protein